MSASGGRPARGGWRGGGRGPARIEVRSRIALIAASAVALAVVLVAVTAYVVVRSELFGGIDQSLTRTAMVLEQERATSVAKAFEMISVPSHSLPAQTLAPVEQVVGTTGVLIARTRGAAALPFTAAVRAVAEGRGDGFLAATTAAGSAIRLLVRPFGHGLALELAARIGGVEADLGRLAVVLLLAAAGGVGIAIVLGAAVSGIALRPVRRLTSSAEEVAASQDLSRRLPSEGRDELSRLAASINGLLAALERSEIAQRQLVADASHELRTPLASLRTNVELLASAGSDEGSDCAIRQLDPQTRRQLASDVVRQFDRVGRLVTDLIELARQDRTSAVRTELIEVDLASLVREVVAEQALEHPSVRIDTDLGPAVVQGVPADLARMVGNLIDNAAKWSAAGTSIEVGLETGPAARLTVTDHGAGIEPDELEHVFDRFYRARSSRSVPGSGLGLAIVRRIVDRHGGTVTIHSTPGEGTRVEVRLPPSTSGENTGLRRSPDDQIRDLVIDPRIMSSSPGEKNIKQARPMQ